MNMAAMGRWVRNGVGVLVLGWANMAGAQLAFDHIVVFGTSLSDPGNAFALSSGPAADPAQSGAASQNTPPYDALDETLVPDASYARGGHHFTNGATWVERFAQGRGIASDAGPAFGSNSGKARNYAVGGARAADHPDRVNLPQQVQAFLGDVGQVAPADSLYVVEMGGNDILDALVAFQLTLQTTNDPAQAAAAANEVISNAFGSMAANIQTLYGAGARKFLIWNAPRVEQVPAVRGLGAAAMAVAGQLADGFNQGLVNQVLVPLSSLPAVQIAQLDVAARMTTILGAPDDFGLADVTDPCITPNVAPFTCQQPDTFFFWDGLHPTKAVHAIIAQLATDVLAAFPNP